MTRPLRFTRLARQDMADAFAWHHAARPGLGDEMFVQLEAALARVARRPEAAPLHRGEVRRAPLRRFPYVVHYVATDRSIDVIGVRPFAVDPHQILGRPPA